MTTPVIDEELMLKMLAELPAAQAGTARLRTGGAMLLLDAFDRDVTRDQFLAAVGATVSLLDMLGRYEMLNNVKAHYTAKGEVTRVDLEVALADIEKQLQGYTAQCTQMAKLLRECPLDEDKVH